MAFQGYRIYYLYRVILWTQRKLPDGRVVGSPKLQIVSFGGFAIDRSHRGTEVISSPAAREKLCLQGSRVTLSSLRALLPNLKYIWAFVIVLCFSVAFCQSSRPEVSMLRYVLARTHIMETFFKIRRMLQPRKLVLATPICQPRRRIT
jgi:hypothetical protein